MFARSLSEALHVEFSPPAHEGHHPSDVKPVSQQKQGQHTQVVIGQHRPKHHKVEQREERIERCACHETLHSAVIADALHQVAHQLRVEETQRQTGQFRQEIRNQGDIDTTVHVQ